MDRKSLARRLRTNSTDAERRLWYYLRAKRFFKVKFRRQVPVGPFIVDFLAYSQQLVIELDGGQHLQQQGYDQRRDAWLQRQGYRVLRFWDNDVLTEPESVLERIRQELTPSPTLPRRRGRGW